MYIADGTIKTFPSRQYGEVRGKCVGWLDFEDGTHEYEYQSDMEVRRSLVEAFRRHTPIRLLMQRGMHVCNLGNGDCGNSPSDRFGGEEYVIRHQGKTYIAPRLIVHYIISHWYQPPADFVEAVLHGESLKPS